LKTCKLIVPHHKTIRKTSILAFLNSVWETGLVSLQKDMRWPYSAKYASDFRGTPAWNTNLSHLRKDLRIEATQNREGILSVETSMIQSAAVRFWLRPEKPRDISQLFVSATETDTFVNRDGEKKKREKWQPDTTIVMMLLGIWYRPITSATRRITGKKFNSETDITFCVENNS